MSSSKQQRKRQTEAISEADISMAVLKRIRVQSLCHLVGQSVSGNVVMRFRKAGMWDDEIAQPIPPLFMEVLSDVNHSRRIPLPDGPLVVFADQDSRVIIPVAEHLLSHDPLIRQAALNYFLAAKTALRCWVSPYVLSLLQGNENQLNSTVEATWISAGITLRDAIDRDFLVNCAGARQASNLRIDDAYHEYIEKVFHPRANCFEHDRPPVSDPLQESKQIEATILELSSLDDLVVALDRYVEYCGYVPLSSPISAGSLISLWKERHPECDLWVTLWKWIESRPTVLLEYHAVHAFLEHPEWIRIDEIERLTEVVQGAITSSEANCNYVRSPLWQLRATLLQHYQMHLEALVPGLRSEVAAAAAAWLTETVAQLFHTDPKHVSEGCEFLQSQVVPSSWARWSISRSRMTPSTLRLKNLYSPFIWSDALLATAVENIDKIPAYNGIDAFRRFLIDKVVAAVSVGSIRTTRPAEITFAFETPVTAVQLALPDTSTDDDYAKVARSLLDARSLCETAPGLRQLFLDIRETPAGISEFLCANLRSWPVAHQEMDAVVREFLLDDDWRKAVLGHLPIISLEKLLSFLVDWQMQQEEDWFVRVPQYLAFECERAIGPERSNTLLFWTSVSSMASDVASPIVRLLTGSRRTEFAPLVSGWSHSMRSLALASEPWLSARVRGFLGTIEGLL